MKVLLLCNKSPFPAIEGGPIAMDSMIRGLMMSGIDVSVLAVDSKKYPAASLPEDLAKDVNLRFETAFIKLELNPFAALYNLLKGRSYHASRFRSTEFENKLRLLLHSNDFDIIQFETPFLGHYLPLIRSQSNAKVILRAHNIEHRVWERLAEKETSFFKRHYLKSLSRSLKRFERDLAASCDGVITITERDAGWFKSLGLKKIISFPFGINIGMDEEKDIPAPDAQLFHLGSMDWLPNLEGINWFLKEIWPQVKQQNPTAKLHLAGRNMPSSISDIKDDRILVHGEVPDAMVFMQTYGIMIVPLLSGSGMRIKIIEGMQNGRAIISTSLGAEGIECTDGKNILLADSAEQFAQGIARLVTDESLRCRIGEAARRHIRQAYNLPKLMPHLLTFYRNLKDTANGES